MRNRLALRLAVSTLLVALIGLTACGCSKAPVAARGLTDDQIIARLNKRVGSQACCFYAGKDQNGDAVYGPLKAPREIQLIVRRSVADQEIACGISGFPPARAFNGRSMPSGEETIFVAQNQHISILNDMTSAQFDRLQDQLCGPDWVKPLRAVVVPTVR